MVYQKALHEERGQPEERIPVVFVEGGGRWKGLDSRQLQIQFVDQNGGLPGMIGPLAAHTGRGQAAQFGIEQLHQLTG
jgi:hypothetical protein